MVPTPAFLPAKCHGQRSLVGYSPWGHQESDTTEQLSRHAEAQRAKVLLPPSLSAGPTFSFQRPLVSLPHGLPSSKPSIETLSHRIPLLL